MANELLAQNEQANTSVLGEALRALRKKDNAQAPEQSPMMQELTLLQGGEGFTEQGRRYFSGFGGNKW